MMRPSTRASQAAGALALSLILFACAPPGSRTGVPGGQPRAGTLPPVPRAVGPLAIDVVYPGEGQGISVDSNFVFGSVGVGGATLSIDGSPVPVAPNGAFLAFLAVPADGRYDLQASAGGSTATAVRSVRVPAAVSAATPAVPTPGPAPVTPEPPPVATPTSPSPQALRVGVVASQRADRVAVATAIAGSGTPYNWFFPLGTRLTVDGAQGGQYRVRLTEALTVWMDTAEVDLLPTGSRVPAGFVSTVTAIPAPEHVDVRLSLSERLPFRVDGSERGLTITVYGAETRTNILQYGATDPLIRRMDWEQVTDDVYRVQVDLSEPLWGFLPSWDARGNLVVRIQRTPRIDPADPLRGIHVAVDAGHPPGGAIGPTRLTEAEATLAVTRRLIPMLRARGARVLEVRPDMTPIGPNERVQSVIESGADLFVSVHFDAFADGTNPFQHYGTHVLFNQPQSLEFARAMQAELLSAFGLPDLGVRRQDVAVIRIPSMPAILTETMFMMFPEQEAALRSDEGLDRIAERHVRGIEAFLRSRATAR